MDNNRNTPAKANLMKKEIGRFVLYKELSKYYTADQIDQMLVDIATHGTIDLNRYVKKCEVDSTLSPTSEMPVQNKVIYEKLMDYYNKEQIDEMLEQLNEINATLSEDGKLYNNFFAGDIYYTEQDTGVRVYWVAFADGEASEENPVTISALNFYRAENATDAVRMSLSIKTVSTGQQQSLTPKQQVQAQNNMMAKAYTPAQFSGLGKKVLSKNMQDVEGTQKNVMTQAFFQDSQGNELTNTVFVIQYDYVLGENITIPAGCTLQFDGGSISGAYTLTGNDTIIAAAIMKIFGTDITIAGSWNIAAAHPEWFGANGDGVTVDTAAFRKCLAAFNMLTLDEKTYIIDDTLTVNTTGCAVRGKTRNTSILEYRGSNAFFDISAKVLFSDFNIYVPFPEDISQIITTSPMLKINGNSGQSIFQNLRIAYTTITKMHYGEFKGTTAIKILVSNTGVSFATFDKVIVNEADYFVDIEINSGGWVNSNRFTKCVAFGCDKVVKIRTSGYGSQAMDNDFDIAIQNEVQGDAQLFDISGNLIQQNKFNNYLWDVPLKRFLYNRVGARGGFLETHFTRYSEAGRINCVGILEKTMFSFVSLDFQLWYGLRYHVRIGHSSPHQSDIALTDGYSDDERTLQFYFYETADCYLIFHRFDYPGWCSITASGYGFTFSEQNIPAAAISDGTDSHKIVTIDSQTFDLSPLSIKTTKGASFPFKIDTKGQCITTDVTGWKVDDITGIEGGRKGIRYYVAQSTYLGGGMPIGLADIGHLMLFSQSDFGNGGDINKGSIALYFGNTGSIYSNIYNGKTANTWRGWRRLNTLVFDYADNMSLNYPGTYTGEIGACSGKPVYWANGRWNELDGAKYGVKRSGTFAQKPIADDIYVGFQYFNTDTHKMITHDGTTWWNPDGTEATA